MLTQEKRDYFKQLRYYWKETKRLLDDKKIDNITAIIREHGLHVSAMSFFFVSLQMEKLGYPGLPYVDCKTFKGWRRTGFQVRKGEHSHIKGIVWMHPIDKEGNEDTEYIFPKEYHLFHRNQVNEL